MVWAVVNWLTKLAHFILFRLNFSIERLMRLYLKEVVRLHRVSIVIVSDRDVRFTARFWEEIQQAMGTRL